MLPNAFAIKSVKNHLRKSCSALAPKVLVKLTPAVFNNDTDQFQMFALTKHSLL
jgi:hypothetical protein